jgi:hypothetical protein
VCNSKDIQREKRSIVKEIQTIHYLEAKRQRKQTKVYRHRAEARKKKNTLQGD